MDNALVQPLLYLEIVFHSLTGVRRRFSPAAYDNPVSSIRMRWDCSQEEKSGSVPEPEFINHLVYEFGMIAVDLINAKPGRKKFRIDIFLAVDTGSIKSDPLSAHILGQDHFELIAFIDCQRELTHHLDSLGGDINQVSDQLFSVPVE
jgi:hypothetical protein